MWQVHYLSLSFCIKKKSPTLDLLSQAATHLVSSALRGLASGFGMVPGVAPTVWRVEENISIEVWIANNLSA